MFAANVWSQNITGTILGTVRDGSGAVVSGASATVTHVDTNQTTATATNNLGNFEAPYLRPGTYQVKVSAAGFKTVVRDNVVLQVDSRLRLDFALELGDIATTIAVTGEAPLVESSAASLGQVVTSRSIAELPIRGRNVFDLVGLAPGVQVNNRAMGDVASTGSNAAPLFVLSDISINGGRFRTNDFMLDGVSIMLPENNNFALSPTPDGTQEFKVQTNNFGPEFGRSGGGVINVVTKGGSNAFHGSVSEFFRNDRLRANNYFANARRQARGIFHFNLFGASAGGRIVRDKTFFFAEYQGHREDTSFGGRAVTLPTLDQRRGDFSNLRANTGAAITIFDPRSTTPAAGGTFVRTPFAGNRIPAGQMDPAAVRMMSFLPAPNRAGEGPGQINNYAFAPTNATGSDQWSVRVDQRFSDKHGLFVRVTRNSGLNTNTGTYGTIADDTMGAIENRVLNGVINGTYTLSANKILSYRYGAARRYEGRVPIHQGKIDLRELGFPTNVVNAFDPKFAMFPTINTGNYNQFGQTSGDPIRRGNDIHTWVSDSSIITGRHTAKFGGDVRLYNQTPLQGFPVQHSYSFARSQTQGPNPLTPSLTAGDGFASYLTGFGTGSIRNTPAFAIRNWYWAVFVNDEIKMGKLTVNVGLRYEVEEPRTERYNRFATFDFARPFPIRIAELPNLAGVLTHPGQDGEPRGNFDAARKNFGPRIGLAYRMSNRMVLRVGYGIFYAPRWGTTSAGGFGASGEEQTTPWLSSLDGVTPVNFLSNPYPDGVLLPFRNQAERLQVGQSISMVDRRSLTNTYTQQWNFGVQRELRGGFVVETAYAGNKGTRLGVGNDPNQIDPQFQALGAGLNQQVTNPFFGLVSAGALSTRTVARSQLLRPFPHYGGMIYNNPARAQNMGSSSYHSFLLRAEKRFTHGINLTAAYTNSKLIDDSSGRIFGINGNPPPVQNSYNLRAERSLSEGDVSQRLVVNHTVDLPFAKRNRFIGGWSVSGTATLARGFPLWLSSTGNSGVSSSRLRPNSTGQSAELKGDVQTRLGRYFDISQFTVPAPFSFGNVSRTLPEVRLPGLRAYDVALSKRFLVREPLSLLFRAETFNLTNTPYFSGSNTPGGNPGTNLGGADFGVINFASGERQVQFSLKVIW